VAAEVASSTETSIWDGASGADNFDGLRALALADGTVNDVTGTPSTSANVVAELGKIVDAKSHTFYNGGEISFDGVKLYPTSGLRDNCAIAARQSNLFFGTGLLDDRNEVRVIDMAPLDGSQNYRIVMRYTAGVQLGIGADVVLYD